MFGDGVFGPTGAVWCCALVFIVPTAYVTIFAALMRISFPFAVRVAALATICLVYVSAGYLFGDAIGLIAAVATFFTALPAFVLKTQRTVISFGQDKAKRIFRDNMGGGTFIFGDTISPDDEQNRYDE
jgi:hypothetical protein